MRIGNRNTNRLIRNAAGFSKKKTYEDYVYQLAGKVIATPLNIFSVHGHRVSKSHIYKLTEGAKEVARLDFQGRTANGSYNFQIQAGKYTYAAVIVDEDIFDYATEKRMYEALGRQIAGAFRHSYGAESATHSYIYEVYNADRRYLLQGYNVKSHNDPMYVYDNGLWAESLPNLINNHELLESGEANATIQDINDEISNITPYVGTTVDFSEVDPINTLQSLKNSNVFDFKGDEEAVNANLIYNKKPSIYVETITKTMTNSYELEKKLSFEVSGGDDEVFSSSASFSRIEKQMTENNTVFAVSHILVINGNLRISKFPEYDKMPLSNEFKDYINALDIKDSSSFDKFIEDYGTHFLSGFDSGGKGYQLLEIDTSEVSKSIENKTSISAESKEYFLKSGASNDTSSTFKNNLSQSSGTMIFNGGSELPPIPHQGEEIDFSSWVSSVPESQAPVNMTFTRIDQILTSNYFKDDKDIEQKRTMLKQKVDQYLANKNTNKNNGIISSNQQFVLLNAKPPSDEQGRSLKFMEAYIGEIFSAELSPADTFLWFSENKPTNIPSTEGDPVRVNDRSYYVGASASSINHNDKDYYLSYFPSAHHKVDNVLCASKRDHQHRTGQASLKDVIVTIYNYIDGTILSSLNPGQLSDGQYIEIGFSIGTISTMKGKKLYFFGGGFSNSNIFIISAKK